jgi:MFS transporter, DHA2 family, methylenomycin A resistance protein
MRYRSARERNLTLAARSLGVWLAGASVALTAGPLAGGALIALSGWRSIFLVNLPIGLLGLFLTWRYAEETPRSPRHGLDLPGQAAAIVALGCLVGALIEGGKIGWSQGVVFAAFGVAIAAAIVFLWQERRARQPMLPLLLFRQRLFTLTTLVGLLVNVAFYGLIFVFSLYFQQVDGWSALVTGLAFVPMLAAVLPVNLLASRIAQRLGASATIAAGAVIGAWGWGAPPSIAQGKGFVALCAPLVALGAGLGLLVPPLTSTLLGNVEKARSGLAACSIRRARPAACLASRGSVRWSDVAAAL